MQRHISFLPGSPESNACNNPRGFEPGPAQKERNEADNGQAPLSPRKVDHDAQWNPYKERAQEEVGQYKNAKKGDGASDIWLFDTYIVLRTFNVDYFGQL